MRQHGSLIRLQRHLDLIQLELKGFCEGVSKCNLPRVIKRKSLKVQDSKHLPKS